VQIEVVYALPGEQILLTVELADGATVADALAAVADAPPFSELDTTAMPVGVHGVLVERNTRLRSGDRVEIYRPLLTDPMQARRRRAGGD
jgi:putative ubiquitin-RnfH superfamily antitoxin RatB of RatAB toxin-antitoxin module